MEEKESVIKWLRLAMNEIECHAQWWDEMSEPWCKARARQAQDMVIDLKRVIKEVEVIPKIEEPIEERIE